MLSNIKESSMYIYLPIPTVHDVSKELKWGHFSLQIFQEINKRKNDKTTISAFCNT